MPNAAYHEELYAIFRLIKYSEGFSFGYAQCNSVPLRRVLADELRPLLAREKINLMEVNLSQPVENLRQSIKSRLDKVSGRSAIFVYGFEHSLGAGLHPEKPLSILNMERELFPKELPYPMILWLPAYALSRVQQYAPDFFAWRSGVYEFKEEPVKVQQEQRMAVYDDYVDKLSLEQKQEKIKILCNLLVEYRGLGDARREKEVTRDILWKLGDIYQAIGEIKQAEGCYLEGLEASRELNNRGGIAGLLHQLGMVHQRQGDYPAAVEKYQASLKIAQALGDKAGIASALHQLGMVHQRQGDYPAAVEKYQASLEIERELGNKAGIAQSLHQLGMVHQDQGDYPAAVEKYQASLDIKRELGDKAGIAQTLGQLGMVHQRQGDLSAALEKLLQARAIFQQIGDKPDLAVADRNIARIRSKM